MKKYKDSKILLPDKTINNQFLLEQQAKREFKELEVSKIYNENYFQFFMDFFKYTIKTIKQLKPFLKTLSDAFTTLKLRFALTEDEEKLFQKVSESLSKLYECEVDFKIILESLNLKEFYKLLEAENESESLIMPHLVIKLDKNKPDLSYFTPSQIAFKMKMIIKNLNHIVKDVQSIAETISQDTIRKVLSVVKEEIYRDKETSRKLSN